MSYRDLRCDVRWFTLVVRVLTVNQRSQVGVAGTWKLHRRLHHLLVGRNEQTFLEMLRLRRPTPSSFT